MNLQLVTLFLLLSTFSSASPLNSKPRPFSQYPAPDQVPDISLTPQSWTEALSSAKQAGLIPNIPPSSSNAEGQSYYESSLSQEEICSWTVSKCYGSDLYHAPSGIIGLSFDDGITSASSGLYDYLNRHNQSTTHFLIGSNLLDYPELIQKAAEEGNQHFAVHTWSHPKMTSLSDEQVLAELGWTMQIIFDLTGKISSFWRPSYGDVDNRVRAIAENVFGLITVLWDEDSNDWCTNPDGSSSCPAEDPGESEESISNALQSFIHQTNLSKGLLILEHETSTFAVNHFKDFYPQLEGLGWTPKSIPDMYGMNWYSNSVDGKSPTTNQTEMVISFSVPPKEKQEEEEVLKGPEQANEVASATSPLETDSFDSVQDQVSGSSHSFKVSLGNHFVFYFFFHLSVLGLL